MAFTVVVPAKDEAALLPATLAALASVPRVGPVVVVDDASTDGTGDLARAAGATVLRRERSAGKAAALMAGASHALVHGLRGEHGLVLVDADLADSATGLTPVLETVAGGGVDLAIAMYGLRTGVSGKGRVVRLAREAIRAESGWAPEVPLSGVRAMTWAAWEAVTPLGRGWAVETVMTLDALAAGLRVVEVPTTMTHRATGRGWRGVQHRGRQYVDVQRALLTRRLRSR